MRLVVAIAFLFSLSAIAQVITAKDPRPTLKRQLQILDSVSKYLDKTELPRLKTINKVVEEAMTAINSHTNIAHRESVQAVQRVVLVFRYSMTFFDQIKSELLASQIGELQKHTDTLSTDFGFDLAEGTNIVELILRQVHSISTQLLEADLPQEIRQDVSALLPVLGRAIAVATTGDRPNAYAAGDEVYMKISALYEKFNKVSISQSGFSLIQELVELNEFYANYAQINSRINKAGGK